jgi:hypothetical protein
MENTLTIPFGKYNGKSIQEVSQTDMNWLIWFTKNYDPHANFSPNRYVQLKAETIAARKALLREAGEIVQAYFDEIAQRNKENSISEYVGDLKKRMNLTLTVKKITNGEYSAIVATTENGSEVRFYDKGFELTVGDTIKVAGTPTKFIEVCGVKQTYINRVNVIAE